MNIEEQSNKQVLVYEKNVEAGRLLNDLYEALPILRPKNTSNGYEIALRIFQNGSTVTLWVPAEIDPKQVEQVIDAHDPDDIEEVTSHAVSSD